MENWVLEYERHCNRARVALQSILGEAKQRTSAKHGSPLDQELMQR
jgi:hypothetical protein